MAKAKSGGTRSYLRGKVGADVYSIGKDGQGKKQQVVRSLAESVKNPQTQAQMFGRMVMSTVMQMKAALSAIIDHSFDNVGNGQPSISEFVRRNYKLVAADAKANPASGNAFGLVKYGERGAKAGAYVIADGSAILPAACVDATVAANGILNLVAGATATTAGAFRQALGLAAGDYMTLVVIKNDGTADFVRVYVSDALADATTISAENCAQLVTTEGTVTPAISWDSATGTLAVTIAMSGTDAIVAHGIIVSQKKADGWAHNDATLTVIGSNPDYVSNTALPTYPVGSERFLNGGDL